MRDLLYEDVVAARLAGITKATLHKKCREGKIPGAVKRKVGRRVVWMVPVTWVGPAYAKRIHA